MRILLACLQSLRKHNLPAYGFWRPYFVEGCREAGFSYAEVPDIDWAEGLTYSPGPELDRWRAAAWEKVLDFVKREQVDRPIDLFLGYLYPVQVEESAITELQSRGIPCVNFFCDNVREFRSVPQQYRPFALNWVPEFEALPMYRRAGLPHLYAPMPCWVPPQYRSLPAEETEPATFIGSADSLRRDLLSRAINAGADFVVRGPGWGINDDAVPPTQLARRSGSRIIANQAKLIRDQGLGAIAAKVYDRLLPLKTPPLPGTRIHEAAFGDDYFRVTRQALITLGVNRVQAAGKSVRSPLTYSRLRDIEAPMLGACYLTEWTAGLGDLYELGDEIESYRSVEELCEKIGELKRDAVTRRRLRERGQRRALEQHSVARTLQRIVQTIGA